MPSPVARADAELRMMETMVDCAFALGMGFGEAAREERDPARRLDLFTAFDRGFTAARLGIRLSMTLRAAPKPAREAASDREAPERESLADPKEREDREPAERDRDRDDEPVSLSRFLSTLRGVAADATRLPTSVDAGVLPTLHGLLAQVGREAPARPASVSQPTDVLDRPRTLGAKARLLGSAAPPPRPSG